MRSWFTRAAFTAGSIRHSLVNSQSRLLRLSGSTQQPEQADQEKAEQEAEQEKSNSLALFFYLPIGTGEVFRISSVLFYIINSKWLKADYRMYAQRGDRADDNKNSARIRCRSPYRAEASSEQRTCRPIWSIQAGAFHFVLGGYKEAVSRPYFSQSGCGGRRDRRFDSFACARGRSLYWRAYRTSGIFGQRDRRAADAGGGIAVPDGPAA